MSDQSAIGRSNTKERSLLVAYGCSSSLAKEVLPALTSYTDHVLFSSKTGSIGIQGNQLKMSQIVATSPSQFVDIFEKLKIDRRSNFSEITVISFAGISDRTIFKNLTQPELDELINVNFRSTTYLSSAILDYFGVGKTSMIFVSSTRALLGDRGLTMYSATKHALIGLARGLALEYGKFGLRANVLSLGMVPVGLVTKVPNRKIRAIIERSANNDFVSLASIVQSIDFLRTNGAINGTTLHCDAGYF